MTESPELQTLLEGFDLSQHPAIRQAVRDLTTQGWRVVRLRNETAPPGAGYPVFSIREEFKA